MKTFVAIIRANAWFYGVLLALIVLCALGIVWLEPVQAAQPAPPTVTPCELVNTFGAISIARCQPENGAAYFVNSMGFMLAGEQ